jgi:hypothetical protein
MRIKVTVTMCLIFALAVEGAESKAGLAEVAAGAGVQHARNTPHEWGSGIAGFGKRLGSAFGTHFVKVGIQLPVAAIRHEAVGYRPLRAGGFRPRLKHALLSTVVTRKTTTGKQTVALGRISGTVGSGFISRLWQPARLRTVSSGISSSGTTFGVDAGRHVVQEFWPEIRHPLKR